MKRNKSFVNNQNVLYLVATPIGNLKELTPRAIEAFNDADIIAAEDTRNTYSLLAKFDIKKELFSLREHNEKEASLILLNKIREGKKICYVSDAGYPGISDPGYILVQEAIKQDIPVSTICGSSAFINALVVSGLPTDHFYFYGFLPPKENEAKSELEQIKKRNETLIFYESPHKIMKTLKILFEVLGDREITLARELTKINEEFIRGTLSELITLDEKTLIGEMVLIVKGNEEKIEIDDKVLIERVNFFVNKGLSKKDAIEITSEEYKINKNYVYNLIHK